MDPTVLLDGFGTVGGDPGDVVADVIEELNRLENLQRGTSF